MRLTIAGVEYASKQDAEERAKAIRARPVGTRIVSGPDFDFLYSAISRHPDRAALLGSGVLCFEVVANPAGPGHGIRVEHVDGSESTTSRRRRSLRSSIASSPRTVSISTSSSTSGALSANRASSLTARSLSRGSNSTSRTRACASRARRQT